jgi:hypothetical protein
MDDINQVPVEEEKKDLVEVIYKRDEKMRKCA